jgi:hypothetical protein
MGFLPSSSDYMGLNGATRSSSTCTPLAPSGSVAAIKVPLLAPLLGSFADVRVRYRLRGRGATPAAGQVSAARSRKALLHFPKYPLGPTALSARSPRAHSHAHASICSVQQRMAAHDSLSSKPCGSIA